MEGKPYSRWWEPIAVQVQKHVKDEIVKKISDLLSLVTGGANGRGEHIRSFTNEEQYTPSARTMRRLQNWLRR